MQKTTATKISMILCLNTATDIRNTKIWMFGILVHLKANATLKLSK